MAYQDSGKRDKAIGELDEIIQIDPSFGQAYYKRAVIYLNEGDYTHAMEDAIKAKSLGVTQKSQNLMDIIRNSRI